VAERTIGWAKVMRRLRVWHDRLAVARDAWDKFAACVIFTPSYMTPSPHINRFLQRF